LLQCAGAFPSYALPHAGSLGHGGYGHLGADFLGHGGYVLLGAGFLGHEDYAQPDAGFLRRGDYGPPGAGCLQRADYGPPGGGGCHVHYCDFQDLYAQASDHCQGCDFRLCLLSHCDSQVRQCQYFRVQSAARGHGYRCMLRCGLTKKYEYWGCGRRCACLPHDSFLQRADYVLLGGDSLQHVDYAQPGAGCLANEDYAQPGAGCLANEDYALRGVGCLQRVDYALRGVGFLHQGLALLTLRGGGKTLKYGSQLCQAPSYPSCQRHLA
jgi:hypothetical protein